MRKNAKKYISLKCNRCGKVFDKEPKEYNRRIKRNIFTFYCSRQCVRNQNNLMDDLSPFRYYLKCCRHNARTRDIQFGIELKDLKDIWEKQRGVCPYTNINMFLLDNTNKDKISLLYCASVDRIDSNLGYFKNNIEFVCRFINWGKNGFPKQDVVNFISAIKNNGSLPE
jgi:DNA-directed RNA polymerase subunit N (RpoN/RPB10)